MGHYLINFSVYTMAMIGLILFALFIFKSCTSGAFSKKSSMLNIIDTMKLSPRKTLYVIEANNEKFLIAADMDKTSLISKLENNEKPHTIQREDKSSQLKNFDGIKSMDDFSSVIDFQPRAQKGPVMRELAKKLKNN